MKKLQMLQETRALNVRLLSSGPMAACSAMQESTQRVIDLVDSFTQISPTITTRETSLGLARVAS